MCYMVLHWMPMGAEQPERVGVRELRQNLSVYLRRVREGETLEVTERGRAVARLSPLGPGGGTLDDLVAEGRARAARGRVEDLPPLKGKRSHEASRALLEQRGERL